MARKFDRAAKAKFGAILVNFGAILVHCWPAQNFAWLRVCTIVMELSSEAHGHQMATAQAKTHDFAQQIGSFVYGCVSSKMIRVLTSF